MATKELETCFEYCEAGKGYFSSNENRWINRIKKLSEERPDECTIIKEPKDNGGFIYAKMPASWLHIKPPVKREMSDSQRLKAAERLRQAREAKKRD